MLHPVLRCHFQTCDQISGVSSLCHHVGHKTGQIMVCVRFWVWGEVLSFTGYPNTRNIHLLFPVLRCLTCGRKCRLHTRKEETQPPLGGKGGQKAEEGVGESFRADPCELTFEGEANPRSRLQGRTSARTQGQQEELGSRCCHGNSHAGSPQRSKSGQEKRKQRNGLLLQSAP